MTTLTAVKRILRAIGESVTGIALDTGGTTVRAEAENFLDQARAEILRSGDWFINQWEDFEVEVPDVKLTTSSPSGTFTYDETVTESGSGATGKFRYEESSVVYLYGVSGTFTGATTTITGATSGATRQADAYAAVTEAKMAFDNTVWYTAEPDKSETINFAPLGSFFYDFDDKTTTFDDNIFIRAKKVQVFTDLTDALAEHIATRAAIEFYRFKTLSDPPQVLLNEALRAEIAAKQENSDFWNRSGNLLETREAEDMKGNRRIVNFGVYR